MASAQVPPAGIVELDFKLGSVCLLFSSTLFCGFALLWLLRGTGKCGLYSESRYRALDLLGCWAAGVFLASSLLNMVPNHVAGMTETFSNLGVTLRFPVPEFILAMGFLLVLVIEQVVLAHREQSSIHMAEKQALLVGSSVQPHDQCHPQYSHQYSRTVHSRSEAPRGKCFGGDAEVSSLSTVRVFVLVFSLSLCSVFEGLAVGLQEAGVKGLDLSLSLLFRKGLTALCLAIKLTQDQLRRVAVTTCLLLFSATCPLGAVLGIGLRQTHTAPQYQLACSTLQGLAAGSFLYVTAMEVLPYALSSGGQRITKVTLLLTGFTAVTVLLLCLN
ncbi:zinc transporter ZIP1-like [Salminus brasiliensis]|uniref:zinc transporter ZIP1-like n=1 Tax=Salminus brasiliensis TaxID=930266 RepID=UPI003B839356